LLKVALHVTLFMDMLKQMSNPKRGALVAIQSRIAAERQKPLVSQVCEFANYRKKGLQNAQSKSMLSNRHGAMG